MGTGQKTEGRKFNKRMFSSMGLLISALGLPISGLMNHNLGFSPMGPERHLWMTIHNLLGIFFVFFGSWHILLNRKSLGVYLKKTVSVATCREGIMALAIVSFFLTIGILHTLILRR